MRALLVLLVLAGCGEPVPPDSTTVAKPKVAKKTTEEIMAELQAAEPVRIDTYYYNPAGKRDPFQGTLNRKSQAPQANEDPDRPPLQRWDVEKFVLRGVIFNTAVSKALLVDPDGLGHVVKVGTYVGRNWGKVSAISQDCVVVTEEYQTIDGELVVNPVSLCFVAMAAK